jgi:hypothetical protein
MRYTINTDLLTQARVALSGRDRLYWIIGGAGSGKSTICRALSARFSIPIYDMDAQIYGAYHGRFTTDRHPVNRAWSSAGDGLAWLLAMSWEEFDSFNHAALAEYLDLLTEDLADTDLSARIMIDGGIATPALLAQVIPPCQMVCLAVPEQSSAKVWNEPGERSAMKEAIFQLPKPEEAWRTFLEFDERITQTIRKECQEHAIPICSRGKTETIDGLAERVAQILGMQESSNEQRG